jgi:hypothetical protein
MKVHFGLRIGITSLSQGNTFVDTHRNHKFEEIQQSMQSCDVWDCCPYLFAVAKSQDKIKQYVLSFHSLMNYVKLC